MNFAQSIDNERLNTIINKSCFIPNEDSIICDDNEGSLRVGSSDNTNSKSASKELKLKNINRQMNLVLRQQQEINQAIYKFTKFQTETFQKQNEVIQKVNNALNGVLILLSAQNKTSIPLVQQAAQETQNYLSTVGQSNIERGINNTFELLNVLNSNSGHSQPQSSVPPFTQQPQPLPPSLSNLLHPETLNILRLQFQNHHASYLHNNKQCPCNNNYNIHTHNNSICNHHIHLQLINRQV